MMKTFSAYLELTKPRVVLLMLITAWVGMGLSGGGPLSLWIWGTLGIAFLAGAAATCNHIIDKEIDEKMQRTQYRPLPQGTLSTKNAFLFALIIGVIGFCILWLGTNALTAWLTAAALIGYAVIYTIFLKRRTPQNIVIGGLAGALPPLLGWTAMTGNINPEALVLVMIIFLWTPPHFWALAIYRHEEYAKAAIPMLPITHGIAFTKNAIIIYTLLLIIATTLPFLLMDNGLFYLLASTVLNIIFLYYVLRLKFSDDLRWGMKTFRYSIIYLFALFIILLVDYYLF
jgi:protoheme IX farnesyltransferase